MSLLGTRYVPSLDAFPHGYANGLDLSSQARARVVDYLRNILNVFGSEPDPHQKLQTTAMGTADAVFKLLTSRPFGYLGRSKSRPYRDTTIRFLQRDIERSTPIQFYFDIGPGYHASMAPGMHDLNFHVGFSELMLLRQVKLFQCQVAQIYAPGAKFFLVVDNLCGLATNDVPIAKTIAYIAKLRSLIDFLGQSDGIEVLAESEVSDWAKYETVLESVSLADKTDPATLCDVEIDNVARFLGRPVSSGEAAARMDRYRKAGWVTEALLENVVDGVRLTQRHTDKTLCFRSFPGGAQRLQVGELALVGPSADVLRPVLITSQNISRHRLGYVDLPDVLPPPIGTLLVGEDIAA